MSSGDLPVDYTASASTEDGNGWLYVTRPYYVPYGSALVSVVARDLPPGTYRGNITITAPPGSSISAILPVTFNVNPAETPLPQPGPPLGASVVNAASQTVGVIAPGEILTLLGLNIGPVKAAGLSIGVDGKVDTILNGARVLFDGLPAPILYASPTQVNAVVPYEVAGKASVTIEVEFNGTRTPAGGVPIAASAPAIFTSDGIGQGQANVLNQDTSANGPANPAARGSIIHILATGEGQTIPAGITAEITQDDVKKPVLPVSVRIGGIDATIQDAGSARGQVAGVFQLNVLVPQGVAPGPAVPVVLTAGSGRSQDGVTMAVK